jgi:hypothetical protein
MRTEYGPLEWMMKKHALIVVAAAAFMLFGYQVPARADTITYVQSTVASGNLGTKTFTNATLTLTLTADTSGAKAAPGELGDLGVIMNAGTATVNITGIGTATITDQVAVFSTYNMSAADILVLSDGAVSDPTVFIAVYTGDLSSPTDDLTHILLTPSASLFGYDLRTSIGPITGSGFPCCTDLPDAKHTTMGGLTFSDVSVRDITFSATTSVPEPASLVLLGTGLLFLFGLQLRGQHAFKDEVYTSKPPATPTL